MARPKPRNSAWILLSLVMACGPDPAPDKDSERETGGEETADSQDSSQDSVDTVRDSVKDTPSDTEPLDPCEDPGTDDLDGDGISDAEECEAGTNPLDPSSASAWHPEFEERPRLLLRAHELPLLRELLTRTDEPYLSLQATIRATCASSEHAPEETLSYLTSNGNLALACAVQCAGGDLDACDRSASVIEAMPKTIDITLEMLTTADLRAGQGLLQAVRAWDLLLGVGYPKGHDPELAQSRLHGLGETLWTHYMVDFRAFPAVWLNNHNLKLAATFGLLGMGAPDDPRAARYVNWAAYEIPRLHEYVFAADGGYAEGFNYLSYGMESELPWIRAFRGWLGTGELQVMSQCAHDLDKDCVEALSTVSDPLLDPRLCGSWERLVEALMPWGYTPNTDDGNLSTGLLGISASLCESATQAWGWDFQPYLSTGGSVLLAPDSLLEWSHAPEPVEPSTEPFSRPDSGWVALRSSWDPQSPYALLLAESGIARIGGGGHEHPDALSFLWATRGEYPLMDSGYGSWNLHGEVNDAEAHNLILVDGEGPETADALVLDHGREGPFLWARAQVSFGGVDWTRTLVLVEDSLLLTFDELESLDKAPHELTLLLHGASEELLLESERVRYTLDGFTLEVGSIADIELASSSWTEEHAWWYGTIEHHAVAAWSGTLSTSTRWLTVASLNESAEPALLVDESSVTWDGGWATLEGSLEHGGLSLDLHVWAKAPGMKGEWS